MKTLLHPLFARRNFLAVFASTLCIVSALPHYVCGTELPPDSPLVGTAPELSAWTINVKQKKTLQPPSNPRAAAAFVRVTRANPRIVRIEVDKSGHNRREAITYEDARKSTVFVYDGWAIFQPLDWSADQAMAVPVNHHLSPIKGDLKSDFAGLDWVRPEAYVGKQSYNGQECYYYEDKKQQAARSNDPAAVQIFASRAWIDVNTRLPIAVEDDLVLQTYAYRKSNVKFELSGVFATTYRNALAAIKDDKGH